MSDVDKTPDRAYILAAFERLSRRIHALSNKLSSVEERLRLVTANQVPPPPPEQPFDPRLYTITIAMDLNEIASRRFRGACVEIPYLVAYAESPGVVYEIVTELLTQSREEARVRGQEFPTPGQEFVDTFGT